MVSGLHVTHSPNPVNHLAGEKVCDARLSSFAQEVLPLAV